MQKTNKKVFIIEKIIKRKGNKLYVKFKGYDSSFNSYTDNKRHCIKWVNTFLNHSETLEEILMLKLICLIMQLNQLSKVSQILILQVLN